MRHQLRSLLSKLIFTFLLVSIAGTLITSLIVYTSNRLAFNRLRQEQREAAFVDEVLAYYEENGSWQNADLLLRDELESAAEEDLPPEFEGVQPNLPPPFALVDADNNVIIPNRQVAGFTVVPPEILSSGIVLEVAGEQVGVLLLDGPVSALNAAEAEFLAQTSRA